MAPEILALKLYLGKHARCRVQFTISVQRAAKQLTLATSKKTASTSKILAWRDETIDARLG